MLYNDVIFAVGSILFTLALVPLLLSAYHRGCEKGVMWSAILTASILSVYSLNYADLGLYLAAIPHTAIMWWCIAYFAYKGRNKNKVTNETRMWEL